MPHHIDWLEFDAVDTATIREFCSQAFGWEFHEFGDSDVFAMPGGHQAPDARFRTNRPDETPQTVAYIKTEILCQYRRRHGGGWEDRRRQVSAGPTGISRLFPES